MAGKVFTDYFELYEEVTSVAHYNNKILLYCNSADVAKLNQKISKCFESKTIKIVPEDLQSEVNLKKKIFGLDPQAIVLINKKLGECEIYSDKIIDFDLKTTWGVKIKNYPVCSTFKKILQIQSEGPLEDYKLTNVVEDDCKEKEYADIQAFGATKEVGGSSFCLIYKKNKFLLDLGYRMKVNYPPPDLIFTDFNYMDLNGLFLSHHHADHCLGIPELFKNGFRAPIYASKATMLSYYNTCLDYLDTQTNPRYSMLDLRDSLKSFNIISVEEPS